jgi:hypothetical protein
VNATALWHRVPPSNRLGKWIGSASSDDSVTLRYPNFRAGLQALYDAGDADL